MTVGGPRGGWQRVGPSDRFWYSELPMSPEAAELHGKERRTIFYGEFDTAHEPDAWREYLYDPLRMLKAEDVPLPNGTRHSHLEINILKLEEPEGWEPPDKEAHAQYVNNMTRRNQTTLEVLESFGPLDPSERERHVSTTVINHEIALNPRIAPTWG